MESMSNLERISLEPSEILLRFVASSIRFARQALSPHA